MSLSDKIKGRTFPTQDVTFCLDGGLSAERDRLMAEVARLSGESIDGGSARARNPELAAARKAIGKLEDRMRDSLVTIRVVGMPYAKYNSVQFGHKPRKGHREAFNPVTFFPDAAYKSGLLVEGDTLAPLTDTPRADWDELVTGLTNAEFSELAEAVIAVNGVKAGTGFLDRPTSPRTPDSSETSDSPETSE